MKLISLCSYRKCFFLPWKIMFFLVGMENNVFLVVMENNVFLVAMENNVFLAPENHFFVA
jgi:hypothetical protein